MIKKKTEDLYTTIDELADANKRLNSQNQELVFQIKKISLKKDLKIKEQTKILLEKTKRELAELQNKTYGGSWVFNCLNQKQYWSEEIFHLWGFDPNKSTPEYNTVKNLIHPNDIELFNNAFEEGCKKGAPFDIKFRICIPNSAQKVIRFICKPILDATGKVLGLKGTNEDITEPVNYQNQLDLKVNQRTLKLSKALKKQKEINSIFVSTTSHKLKNPLSAINFAAGSIKKYQAKMDSTTIENKLYKIENQVAQMTVLLNNLPIIDQKNKEEI